MNKALYKNAFKNITVSESVLNSVKTKGAALQSRASDTRKATRLSLPAAIILIASFITVSAAGQSLGLNTAFRSFFSQFYDARITDNQLNIIKKYGVAPDKTYSKSGVTLSVDGVIGDSNLLYVKYSVSMDKGYDEYAHSGIMSNKLYVGDLKNKIQPRSISTSSSLKETNSTSKKNVNCYDYSAIYSFDQDISPDKLATLVMTFPGSYKSVLSDLGDVLSDKGVTPPAGKEAYDIPNSNLNIPLKTDYGQILLDSIGYTNGHLILAVDTSGYYKAPVLYLRASDNNGLYGRDDGFVSVRRDNLELYSFTVASEMLDQLEIVMPEEYHFTFPLMHTNKTKTFNLSGKNMTVNNSTIIKEIRLSPLSITITGTVPSGHETGFLYSDCSIITKDGRSLTVFKGGSGGYHQSEFSINMPFEAPLEIETIKALVIKPASSSKSTEIPLN